MTTDNTSDPVRAILIDLRAAVSLGRPITISEIDELEAAVAQQPANSGIAVATVCLIPERRYPHFAAVEIQLHEGYEPRIGDKLYASQQPAKQEYDRELLTGILEDYKTRLWIDRKYGREAVDNQIRLLIEARGNPVDQ